jgi:hypothetical protein
MEEEEEEEEEEVEEEGGEEEEVDEEDEEKKGGRLGHGSRAVAVQRGRRSMGVAAPSMLEICACHVESGPVRYHLSPLSVLSIMVASLGSFEGRSVRWD